MGRGNDYREPRRRGYDDEQFTPPPSSGGYRPRPSYDSAPSRPARGPEPTGPTVDAVVKWFKSDKGFGFVELSGGGGDAFLHISALQPAGYEDVPPGATLKVMTGQGQKGPQVTRVVEVDLSTASASRPPSGGSAPRPGRREVDLSNAQEVRGVVKWFNGEKGFGFVSDGAGGKDIFIHVSVLQNANMQHLDEGQAITIRVVQTQKGREAAQIVG